MDREIFSEPNEILCESYRDKRGSQRAFMSDNPLELVVGQNFYTKKKKMFDQVVGFAKFSEFLVVAAVSSVWGMKGSGQVLITIRRCRVEVALSS